MRDAGIFLILFGAMLAGAEGAVFKAQAVANLMGLALIGAGVWLLKR